MKQLNKLLDLREAEMGKFEVEPDMEVVVDDKAVAGIRKVEDGVSEISGVFVHPKWRGQGLSRQVMERAHEYCEEIVLLTVDPNNTYAMRLYESLGYHMYDEKGDLIVMVKNNGFKQSGSK